MLDPQDRDQLSHLNQAALHLKAAREALSHVVPDPSRVRDADRIGAAAVAARLPELARELDVSRLPLLERADEIGPDVQRLARPTGELGTALQRAAGEYERDPSVAVWAAGLRELDKVLRDAGTPHYGVTAAARLATTLNTSGPRLPMQRTDDDMNTLPWAYTTPSPDDRIMEAVTGMAQEYATAADKRQWAETTRLTFAQLTHTIARQFSTERDRISADQLQHHLLDATPSEFAGRVDRWRATVAGLGDQLLANPEVATATCRAQLTFLKHGRTLVEEGALGPESPMPQESVIRALDASISAWQSELQGESNRASRPTERGEIGPRARHALLQAAQGVSMGLQELSPEARLAALVASDFAGNGIVAAAYAPRNESRGEGFTDRNPVVSAASRLGNTARILHLNQQWAQRGQQPTPNLQPDRTLQPAVRATSATRGARL